MKAGITVLVALLAATSGVIAQNNVPAVIKLKDGNTIDVYHFGKLYCESNRYADTYTILRGRYYDSPTEISDYSDISQLIFSGFTEPPAASVGNQKGTITAIRKDGVKAELTDADLTMSCIAAGDKYNQIRVQIVNPLTREPQDLVVEMRNIETITFK